MNNKTICLTAQEFFLKVDGVEISAKRIAFLLKKLGYRVYVAVFRSVFAYKKISQSGKI